MTTISTDAKLTRTSLEIDGRVARIVLQNPALNVIDILMMEELSQAIAEIEARPGVSVVVFSGAGKAFSAGVDVAAHTPEKVAEMLAKFHAVIRNVMGTERITIASVHGHCLGGGAELAMVCDLAFTSHEAHWGFPEIKLGCYPPVACTALAALVGQKRAAELILTGRTISGIEAAQMGLANRSVPESQLTGTVEGIIAELSGLSPAALALAKKANYAWDSMHFDKGLARSEKIYLDQLTKTADAQEGIQAFMEKRQPKWIGK